MRYCLFIMMIVLFEAPRAFASDILVFRAQEQEFAAIVNQLKRDLAKYSTSEVIVEKDYTYEKMRAAILIEKPKSLILLDNQALQFAKRLRDESDTYLANMRGVVGMGLNLKKELKDDPRFCGVAYEVPGYTLVTNFRKIYRKRLETVLAIYRKSTFQHAIDDARKQLALEKINLIAIDAEASGSDERTLMATVEKGLAEEVSGQKVDVVWVIGDNGLINAKTFSSIWLDKSAKFSIPFLCGLQQFANPKLNFCTYAASPQDAGIVDQLAQMTLSLIEDGVDPLELGVDYLLSTDKVINMRKVRDIKAVVDMDKDSEVKVLE